MKCRGTEFWVEGGADEQLDGWTHERLGEGLIGLIDESRARGRKQENEMDGRCGNGWMERSVGG